MTDLMRTEEVSQETGIPAATLRYWRHIGTGPRSARLGRRVVYRRSDVEAWIAAQFEAAEKKATA
jgi:predicted DNA-binding transcriptional regulator AlpA